MKKSQKSKLESLLNTKSQQLLHDLVITNDNPGSIVADFNMLLDFIGTKGMASGGKYGFFPMGKLTEINSKLTHSVKLNLKRPQQKAFPHIHGLHLLLRSTGLVYLKTNGKKRYLLLDEPTLQSWHRLNVTEQYFTLLEAWLLHGNNQILLERDFGFPDHMSKCSNFMRHFEKSNIYTPDQKKEMFHYFPGWHNLALLQMFGFMKIKSPQKKIDKFWLIDQIQCTHLTRILIPSLEKDIVERGLEFKNIECFGEWQSLLQPFFPEWKNNLIMKEPEFKEGLYIFEISIGSVWRRISISSDQELEVLSDAILEAFDFDDDHMYQFTYTNRKGIIVEVVSPEFGEPPLTTDVRVGDLDLSPGDSFYYLYDFGDQWEFTLVLEDIKTNHKKKSKPTLLESYGEAPDQYENDEDDYEFE